MHIVGIDVATAFIDDRQDKLHLHNAVDRPIEEFLRTRRIGSVGILHLEGETRRNTYKVLRRCIVTQVEGITCIVPLLIGTARRYHIY